MQAYQIIREALRIGIRLHFHAMECKILYKFGQSPCGTPGQGICLGLSLSYDISNAHGGEDKTRDEKGDFTEFTVQIPAV